MRVLIVEDDPKCARYLGKGLTEEGFVVDTAATGDDGLHLATTGNFDLIILDVALPERDGVFILTELRRSGQNTPVLFLSARDTVEECIAGLNLGADDYLVKPFSFSELLARMRSVLRRGPGRQPFILRIADLEIDLVQHRVCRGGSRIDLSPKEFTLLSFLARRAGEVISRTVIAENVWDMNFDSDTNIVDVQIKRLRAKVDGPFEDKLIHTIRGVGYVLEERGRLPHARRS